jgi:hypothetical protein
MEQSSVQVVMVEVELLLNVIVEEELIKALELQAVRDFKFQMP